MKLRNNILEYIKRELIGPDPVKPHIQENGEEILLNEPPRLRYGAGILFPKMAKIEKVDCVSPDEEITIENADDGNSKDDPVQIIDKKNPVDVSEDNEEEIGLANNYLPSAMGFSCFTKIPKYGFLIKINAAIYQSLDYTYQKNEENL